MTDARGPQRHFGDPFLAEAVEGSAGALDAPGGSAPRRLRVGGDGARRAPATATAQCWRGRTGTPAEIVLRLLVVKHVRNWSDAVVERGVRTNLVYRTFTRIGGRKVPDANTMGKWGPVVGPTAVAQLHARLVAIARDADRRGAQMRVDATVVDTNVHYPTDSRLLGDGVRVLTRTMQLTAMAGPSAVYSFVADLASRTPQNELCAGKELCDLRGQVRDLGDLSDLRGQARDSR